MDLRSLIYATVVSVSIALNNALENKQNITYTRMHYVVDLLVVRKTRETILE